jgi:hypothetical protein
MENSFFADRSGLARWSIERPEFAGRADTEAGLKSMGKWHGTSAIGRNRNSS